MKIDILSLFPEYFDSPFGVSMIKRAIEKGLLDISQVNIRDFSKDTKHKRVDERPFGGGPGMVMMAQPVVDSIRSRKEAESHVIYFTPKGNPLTAKKCEELSEKKHLILLCGHYEGVDERAIEKEVNEEISVGDFVMTNGCIAAIAFVDAVMRFIPGVLGHPEAAMTDSFQEGMLEAPHYTRPESFEGMNVPEVLLSGHHENIDKWRLEMGLKKTKEHRPDLYEKYLVKKNK